MAKLDQGLIDWAAEAMAPIGTVTWRQMMGGATLYCDSVVFAILADDVLWLKADKHSDDVWDEAGCPRFTFEMRGKSATMNYRRAPDDVYDDAEAFRQWGALALEAGRRVPSKKVAAKKGAKKPA